MNKQAHVSLLLCLFAGLSGAAHAAEPTPEQMARAAEIYQNAAILYEEGSYEAAIAGFRASLELSGAPELHYNIANCLERMGKLDEALAELNLYRAFAAAEERERLDRRMRALEDRIAEERAARATTPAPVPVVTPQPVATPTAETQGPSASADKGGRRWGLVATGLGLGLAGGAGAALTWTSAQGHIETGDEEAYGLDRMLNIASWSGVGLGALVATVGFVVPAGGRDVMVGPGFISLTW